jgi:tetratricopeptide (TPR) repeat protein
MSRSLPIVIVVLMVCIGFASCLKKPAGPGAYSPTIQKGIRYYNSNMLDSALTTFVRAMEEGKDTAVVLAYMAATYKYMHMFDQAKAMAKRSIKADPNAALPYAILADLYYPQYGSLPDASYDSTDYYIRQALRCDSMNCEAHMILWSEAYRKNDPNLEASALRHLYSSGFFTKSMLEYHRCLLNTLPQNAILISNGDMDTYPVIALQVAENLRPDVCVANINMLNLNWYVTYLKAKYQIPTKMDDEALKNFQPYYDKSSRPVLLANVVLSDWCSRHFHGTTTRPVVFSGMSDMKEMEAASQVPYGFAMAGPVNYIRTASKDPEFLVQPANAFFDSLKPDNLKEPAISDLDISPLRRGPGPDVLIAQIMYQSLQIAWFQAATKHIDEARSRLAWCKDFMGRFQVSERTKSAYDGASAEVQKEIDKNK